MKSIPSQFLLVAIASTALVKARADAARHTQVAHQQTIAMAKAQETAQRLRSSLSPSIAAAEADAYWETITGCDKPCEFDPEGDHAVLVSSAPPVQKLAYCLSAAGVTILKVRH